MVRNEFEQGGKIDCWEVALKNPSDAMKAIGAILVAESQLAFRDQKFDGKQWRERSVPNVFGIIADFAAGKPSPPKRRFAQRPVLKDTGRLFNTINFRVEGSHSVLVGSPLPYAGVLHQGGKIESEKVSTDVQSRLAKWLKGKGKQWKSKLGFLLSKSMEGKTLKSEVEARPFMGVTPQSREDIRKAVGAVLFK